jgi:cytoskeletal protein CcmA (bactofilin family)
MKKHTHTVARLMITLILLAAPISLFAVEIVKGEASRALDGVVDDDVVVLGETFAFEGRVESLVFFGETLFMSGENSGNLIAAARTLEIGGRVADDTFIAGHSVSLSGELGSTTFAAGETVALTPRGVVRGSLLVGARTAEIAGTIDGDLYVGAGSLVLSGTVHGDVTVGAGEITITEGAVIGGDFTYDADDELSNEERGRITGAVQRRDYDEMQHKPGPLAAGKWVFRIIGLLSLLVFALVFYLFPGTRPLDTDRGHRRFWKTVAWGLIPFFGYPVAIAVVFIAGIVFGITVPIGIALTASLGLVGYILYALALPQIGNYLSTIFGWSVHMKDDRAPFVRMLLGFAPVFVLGLIPVVNAISFVVAVSLGWGIAIERSFNVRLGAEG